MTELRSLVTEVLDDAGVLLPPHREQRVREDAFFAGRRLLPKALGDPDLLREAAVSLGLAEPALVRILGLGWQQTDGLALLAGTSASMRPQVCHAGALFNLGIVLFDLIVDRFADRAKLLNRNVTPLFLVEHLRGTKPAPQGSGDAAIDALTALITEFLARCRQLGSNRREHSALADQLHAMYIAECESSATRRDCSRPTIAVWRSLRRKSAVPITMLARLALLASPNGERERRAAAIASGRLAGQAIWIVDDLADIREDWAAGGWSRPLWWLARTGGSTPGSPQKVLRHVVDNGIADAEARRLALRLLQLRRIADDYGSAFVQSFQATVQAWLEELPG
ncbi:hypothetical protein OKW41_000280 [Paraburkholderia sp. UCT70]|uniref:hypothetical protein n=1 Tax=Paraburkholderia sp. UCT70 TaxID=2991068 RepID=UPI003D1B2F85